MGASGHLGGAGRLPISMEGGVSSLAQIICVVIILGLQINAIKGKQGPMTSIVGVIHCGIALGAVLLLIMQLL
jgi:hypothetical protein